MIAPAWVPLMEISVFVQAVFLILAAIALGTLVGWAVEKLFCIGDDHD